MKNRKTITILNIIFILLAGLFHYLEYPLNIYAETLFFLISNALYFIGVALWYFSVRKRILDEKIKKRLLFIVYLLMGLLFIKIYKYRLTQNYDIKRYLQYFYYIVLFLMITEFLIVALTSFKPVDYKHTKKIKILYIIPTIISTFFLTNDLHKIIYKINSDGSTKTNIGYWIILALLIIEAIAFIVIIVKNCRIPSLRKKAFVPLLLLIIAILYCLSIAIVEMTSSINVPYKFIDSIVILTVLFYECFIRFGLIRSNEKHDLIFEKSSINSFITNNNYDTYYKSSTANAYDKSILEKAITEPFINNDTSLTSIKLKHGYFFYEENIKEINRINTLLKENLVSLDEQNEILKQEQIINEKKLRIEESNNLYSEIHSIIEPYINETLELMDSANMTNYNDKASKSCFILSYVKRQININLLIKKGTFTINEFEYSLAELLSNYKLKVFSNFKVDLNSKLDAKELLDRFNYIFNILYENIDNFEACYISLTNDILRISADTKNDTLIYNYPSRKVVL